MKPDTILLTEKQLAEYKSLVGNPSKGDILAVGYHTWIADGNGGVNIMDEDDQNQPVVRRRL